MIERPTALVTGASRGVGAAVARAFAPTHHVILGGRDEQALAALAAELPDARAWPVELTEVSEADVAGVERLDVLVHNAGVHHARPDRGPARLGVAGHDGAQPVRRRRADPAGPARAQAGGRPRGLRQLRRRAAGQPGVGRVRRQQVRAAGLRRRAAAGGAGPSRDVGATPAGWTPTCSGAYASRRGRRTSRTATSRPTAWPARCSPPSTPAPTPTSPTSPSGRARAL